MLAHGVEEKPGPVRTWRLKDHVTFSPTDSREVTATAGSWIAALASVMSFRQVLEGTLPGSCRWERSFGQWGHEDRAQPSFASLRDATASD